MRAIWTLRDHGLTDLDHYYAWVLQVAARKRKGEHTRIPAPTDLDASARPAIAYVNHGIWVAECPDRDKGCTGAEVLEPGWPFMCTSCCNVLAGHRWRPVRWPKQKGEIEGLLAARPFMETRNWGGPWLGKPETVAQLRADKPGTASLS